MLLPLGKHGMVGMMGLVVMLIDDGIVEGINGP